MSGHQVDAFRFTGRFIKKMMLQTIDSLRPSASIPWAPVARRLVDARVALLTTAGISMRDDPPFDMDRERANPTWGDPSWRAIHANASSDMVSVNHLHIDTSYIKRDINVALPLQRLAELAKAGIVGAAASTHYSIMGFQGHDSSTLENVSAPQIAQAMRDDDVDLAVLAPV